MKFQVTCYTTQSIIVEADSAREAREIASDSRACEWHDEDGYTEVEECEE